MENLISLDNISGDLPLNQIGGKAYGLCKLISHGFKVPEFCVILYSNEMTSEIMLEIDEFADKLMSKYPNCRFSVRSSGVNEDGASKSFAGMYKTFLNVERDEIVDKVLRCRNYSSARLEQYSKSNSLSYDGNVSVIIQRMINPTISGVGFTINPVENTNEIIIETVNGLGEALVSGEKTPDYYKICKSTGDVVLNIPSDDGGKLSDYQLNKLYNSLIGIEDSFGKPMDIEFAFDYDELYILQARPITT